MARRLVDALTRAGIKLWFDERHLNWGESINEAIREGLSRSRHMILLLSPASPASPWFEWELLTAMNSADKERLLLPILIEDCDIPLFLRPFHCLDLRDQTKREAILPKILAALRPPSG